MIIENRRRQTQTENVIKVARISKEDMQDMIIEYLSEVFDIHNLDRSKIKFNTSWKYVTDEWGMNRMVATTFDGVTVELLEVE